MGDRDPRDGMSDWPEEARVAAITAIDARTGPHLQITAPLAMYVATDILNATAPLIRAAERARTERAEARLAEVRQGVTTFLGHYGNTSLASFKVAQDLAEGVLQVLDRDKISSEEDA
jgi:hypothetical protein